MINGREIAKHWPVPLMSAAAITKLHPWIKKAVLLVLPIIHCTNHHLNTIPTSVNVPATTQSKVLQVEQSLFSKNFGLYGQRVGALSIVADSSEEALRVQFCY